MHACVFVFIQVCLCVLTKLFNLSQSLSLVRFWQLFIFRLNVTSFGGFSICVCVCTRYVSKVTECVHVAHMLTIMRQFPQGNQWAGWKVYLNLHYISLQSVGMVVIQTMVNMLARTNQGNLSSSSVAVYSSFWHSAVYSIGVVLGCNLCVCVCVC